MNSPRSPKHAVIRWMRGHAASHQEVNATQLAEAAAHEFDEAAWLDDETHWIWEEAAEIIYNFGDPQ